MSNFSINIDYLRSWSGIFKVAQLVLGTIYVGIIGNEYNTYPIIFTAPCFFLVVTCTFYIGTFILFISYLLSSSAASMIPKTIYEFLYHTIASILLLAGSIAVMVHIHQYVFVSHYYNELLAASICCLLNTILYICSAIIGFSTYGDD